MTPLNSSTAHQLENRFRGVVLATLRSIETAPVCWLLGLLLVIRCGFILFSPLDLIADESYYWDWSRRLDYGYYSKPPMIAWINWLSTSLFGPNEFAVRLPAALLGTVGLYWVYLLGARLFSFRVGFSAMLLLAVTPGHTALSFLMTIDAPFLFCWVAAIYCLWMMTSEEIPPLGWCLSTACWIGLGLLSKQTMLAIFPLTALYLMICPTRRQLLLTPRLWLTAAGGLLFLLPVVYWNYEHDWITLQHTASHFDHSAPDRLRQFVRFLEFFIGQIGVVSPVLWVCIIATLWAGLKQLPRLTEAERFLVCFSAVPLIGVILLSATRRLEPNWPAACYPTGMILTMAVLQGRSTLINVFKNREQHLKWSWRVGIVSCLLTYAAITIVPASPLAGSPVDITCRLRGWKELALQFAEKVNGQSIAGQPPLIISTAGRDITSALAFYLPHQPLIPFWAEDGSGVNCQYDMWDRPELQDQADVLVVATPGSPLPQSLAVQAASWQPAGELEVPLGGGRVREYQLYRRVIPADSSATSVDMTAENATAKPASQTLKR